MNLWKKILQKRFRRFSFKRFEVFVNVKRTGCIFYEVQVNVLRGCRNWLHIRFG